MRNDPIVAEVRKVREQHASQFNFDLQAIYRDLKEQEKRSGRTFVSYPARPVVPPAKTGDTGQPVEHRC
jgi:hypothetical protein